MLAKIISTTAYIRGRCVLYPTLEKIKTDRVKASVSNLKENLISFEGE